MIFPRLKKYTWKLSYRMCVISKRVRIYKIRWLALICSVINLRKNTSDFIHANEWFFQGEKIHKRLHSGEKRHGKRVRIYKIRWLALICCVINLRKITSDFIHADGWFSQGQKNNNNNANAVGIASWKLNVKYYEVTVRYSSRLAYIQAHIWARWGLNLYRVRQTSLRWPDSP